MSTLKVWTRSFHSQTNFGLGGLGFHGDGRGFSTNEGATARIGHNVTIDLTAASIGPSKVKSSPSSHPVLGTYQDYSDPRKQPTSSAQGSVTPYRADGDQQAEVLITYRGQNFAMPGSNTEAGFQVWKRVVPDLDVTNAVNFRINRSEKKIHITCRLAGDGFPDCECFVIDSNGKAIFLATHIRVGSAAGQLFGGRKLAMGSSALEVDWNADDTFGDSVKCHYCIDYSCDCSPEDMKAKMSSNPCSVAAWNAIHSGRNTAGTWRKVLDQLPGAHDSGMPASRMP